MGNERTLGFAPQVQRLHLVALLAARISLLLLLPMADRFVTAQNIIEILHFLNLVAGSSAPIPSLDAPNALPLDEVESASHVTLAIFLASMRPLDAHAMCAVILKIPLGRDAPAQTEHISDVLMTLSIHLLAQLHAAEMF